MNREETAPFRLIARPLRRLHPIPAGCAVGILVLLFTLLPAPLGSGSRAVLAQTTPLYRSAVGTAGPGVVTPVASAAVAPDDHNLLLKEPFFVEPNFAGISDTGSYPPDPIIAVGPDHIVAAVNSRWTVYTKSGTQLRTFFADTWLADTLPALDRSDVWAFDPQVAYDHFSNRWLMSWIAKDDDNRQAWMLVSVSAGTDPEGDWCSRAFSTTLDGSTSTGNWGDFDGLGFDNQAVYITTNQFSFSSDDFAYAKIRILDKARLYGPCTSSVPWRDFWDLRDPDFPNFTSGTVRPAITFGTPGVQYFLGRGLWDGRQYQAVTLWSLTNPLGASPSLTSLNISVASYTAAPDAGQLGGGVALDSGDTRFLNVVYRGSSLWAAHTVADPTGQFSQVSYVRIDVPTRTVVEDVRLGAPNCWYFYPALAVDALSNLHLVFNRSCTTEYVGAWYAVRRAGARNLEPEVLLKAGETNYVRGVRTSAGASRWGDYSGAAVDPSDPAKVWLFAEYASATANRWGTWIAEGASVLPVNYIPADLLRPRRRPR